MEGRQNRRFCFVLAMKTFPYDGKTAPIQKIYGGGILQAGIYPVDPLTLMCGNGRKEFAHTHEYPEIIRQESVIATHHSFRHAPSRPEGHAL